MQYSGTTAARTRSCAIRTVCACCLSVAAQSSAALTQCGNYAFECACACACQRPWARSRRPRGPMASPQRLRLASEGRDPRPDAAAGSLVSQRRPSSGLAHLLGTSTVLYVQRGQLNVVTRNLRGSRANEIRACRPDLTRRDFGDIRADSRCIRSPVRPTWCLGSAG